VAHNNQDKGDDDIPFLRPNGHTGDTALISRVADGYGKILTSGGKG